MRNKNNTYESLLKILLFLYIVLKPIYILPSGLPQISDFVLLLLFILLLFNHEKRIAADIDIRRAIKKIIPFIIWVAVINILWAIRLQSSELLRPILFYVFNYISMITIYKVYLVLGDSIYKHIAIYMSISLIIQFMFVILMPSSSIRVTGFFNNPNQLGLYALVAITILLFFKDKLNKIRYLPYIAILCSIYIILVSLSKAAILGMIALFVLTFVFNNKKKLINIIVVIAAVLVIATGLGDTLYEKICSIPIIKTAATKIERMSNESDSNLGTGRGYDRLKEIGLNIIEGVGEGDFNRFDTLSGSEIHSAYASILCYYGILGFSLLLLFILGALGKNYSNYVLLSGILLYGMTHQIWRNTLIWMLIALIIILNRRRKASQDENKELSYNSRCEGRLK